VHELTSAIGVLGKIDRDYTRREKAGLRMTSGFFPDDRGKSAYRDTVGPDRAPAFRNTTNALALQRPEKTSMNRPPRILVLSASVGAGHMRAAQAVELALRELAPEAIVRNIDLLELTNSAFRRIYGKAYLDLVNRAPHVLGYIYDLMDKPRRQGSTRDRLRVAVEKMNLGKFIRLLRDEEWDLAVNTHFLPAEIIASLRKKGELRLPQMTVTTDFETHRLWYNQPCDHYFTATEEGARYLHSWGVPPGDTTVTGIPIHPVFAKPKDRNACREKHGLGTDRPVILQLAGGFGVGPIVKLYQALLSIERPLEVVVVAGKNAEVKADLEKVEAPTRHRAHILGFTDQIDELMAAADVVVSKPGGLTTSEVLARGAVMVVVNPIPGQESRNSDYLLESGAAIKANNLPTLAYKLASLLDDEKRLAQLKSNVAKIARPRAAYDVARRALAAVGR
jgi:processive 1,2-diacylglycerol beta-glucosyltransferase